MQSIKMKAPIEEREWIEVKGRKLYWNRFINMLDDERWHIPDRVNRAFCSMISPLQNILEDYVYGADEISDYEIDYAQEEGLEIPSDTSLPSAIYDFYNQIESKLHIDLSAALDKAVKLSEEDYRKLSAKRETEYQRREFVHKIAEEISFDTATIQEKIIWILSVQEKKKTDSYFKDENQKKKETSVAELWCSILMHNLNYEYITYGQMLSLVQDGVLSETDISHLLHFYGDERDFEWYSEDCIGSDLSSNTNFKTEDVLEMAEPMFRKILGL